MIQERFPLPHSTTARPTQAFAQAASLHAQGRLWEAERLYRQALRAEDCQFDALYRLGIIRLQQSRFDDAVGFFRRAIRIDKNSAEVHQYLAFALTALERFPDAVRHYEKALAIRPQFAEAENNFGHTLQRLGRLEEAIAHYRAALAVNPAYPEACNNLGNALHVLGRNEEAVAQYERAIAIRPDYAEAHWNLGNALRPLDSLEDAISHYEKAIAIRPAYAEAHNSLGNTLRMLTRTEEAIAHYEKALAITPLYADARINLGDSLELLSRCEEAIAQYDEALAIQPKNADALSKRGRALAQLKRYDEAMASFDAALAIEHDHTLAFNGLLSSAGYASDWERTAKLSREAVARIAMGKRVEPFSFLIHFGDPSLQLACAKTFIHHEIPVFPPRLWTGDVWRHGKIRLAYLSVGFHQHPTAYLTTGLFELHDRSRFEVFGISFGPDDHSEIRARIACAFDQFHDARSKTDREVAEFIRNLEVDIVIDRSGYTMNARPGVFAHRPAPVQVNYIGFPGTLGVDFYDYVIADRTVVPFDQQAFFTEKIVHLPDSYLVTDSKLAIAATQLTRRDSGLPDRGFVFCCFNSNSKIAAPVFDVWMRLLHRVDGSVLWLLRTNAVAEANLRKEAAARGVDPARLIFADRVKLDRHLARHRLADLFLDTLPYNAHTTASDALWAGLPLITCQGEAFAGRVAASVLNAVGLPELVTHSMQEYEALALRLASDPALLRGIREKLQRNRLTHPLFDTDRYRRHIEAAYTKMWELWQRGEPPRSFAVEALATTAVQSGSPITQPTAGE